MDNKNKLLVGGCLLISIDWSNHQANGFERVETSAILRPENAILKFAAVDPSTVPNTVQVGLATRVVPPAALMEVSAVTRKGVLVTVECGELFSVVTAEGIPSIALVCP